MTETILVQNLLHLDEHVLTVFNCRWGYSMTEKQLTERLEKLWVQATASCGSATPQLVEEIRELERMLKAKEDQKETR